jgi:N12 class adenine-specific DNA methylase
MAGKKELPSVPLKQLDFDTLAEVASEDAGAAPEGEPAGNGTGVNGEAPFSFGHGRRKARKSPVRPNALTQSTFDDLFTQAPETQNGASKAAPQAGPLAKPDILSERETLYAKPFRQLAFDSLPETEADLTVPAEEAAGNGIEAVGGELRVSDVAPELRQSELFTIDSGQEPEAQNRNGEAQPEYGTIETRIAPGNGQSRKGTIYEQPGQVKQLDFDTLAELPSEDVGTAPEGKPAGNGTEADSRELRQSDVRSGSREEDGLSGSLGDSDRPVSPAGRRQRRVIPDEPEQVLPSRDFRITEAHGVGRGGLQEKARANLAAIRLLKTLEAEGRDATEEERAVLVRYAGWGALPGVFETEWRVRPEWKPAATELRELLTEEEYTKARATTPNAHFTSPQVIDAIWRGLEKFGLQQGSSVLEPAMGVGHFFGLMPESLLGGQRTGVELDSLTARIARQLYPDAAIFAQGFEETPLPDNYFDVVVGNVPFGDYGVHDPAMKRSLTRSIHDYFFAKSLEKARPGGVMALITSRYTMDKQDSTIRKALAEKADLVAAIRLPNTAFAGNAGTQVTTDILFLQKRLPGQEPGGESWTEAGVVEIDGSQNSLNEYYLRHPEMMLGRLTLEGTMYRGRELTLSGELTEDNLDQAIGALPEGRYISRSQARVVKPAIVIADADASGIKDGGYGEVEGRIVKRRGSSLEPANLSASETWRVRGLMQIRDVVREVFLTQLDNAPEEEIVAARRKLNQVYDRFVGKHGFLTSRDNFRAFDGDPDHPLLLSLENYDTDKQTATKTVIFERRTIERYQPVTHVETARDALAVSLNETGDIHWERMAELTDFSLNELQAELSGQVFQNPEGAWETADEYLSGDVRRKLKAAEAAAALNPLYQTNVEALKAVQPADLLPGDIHARLGASWIPAGDIQDFIAETLQVPFQDVTVAHAGEIAAWSVKLNYFANRAVSNTTTYGTKRIGAADLIEAALNLRVPTIYDTLPDDTRIINQTETIAAREAQQKLKDRFAAWIWEDPERTERLARLYNDTFNNIRLRTYDGSHLSFPGMNRAILRGNDLDAHQKNAVWRVLQNRNTLLGHCVGAGKTYEIAASCMELKRLQLASKPMIVVPNHLVEQWGAAFLALYPQANIFVAGKDFFTTGNREKAMARIAAGNFDAVIVSHKSFELLPVADKTFNSFVGKQIENLEQAQREVQDERGDATRSIIKQIEKAKKRLEAKIKDRAKREKKDDGVTFEQLGIDRIFVDEADVYKNLGFTTKMQRIAGLPNTESNRALDMYMKTRYVSERDGGIIFSTGTPISNTMAEMYTLHRYLAPDLLEATGMSHFDAWAANFGESVTALELSPDGSGYRMHTRFAKFVNLPELLSMFRTFADIQTADMLNLPRPEIEGGKPKVIVSPASEALKAYVSGLVWRAQRIKTGGVDARDDNMLKITTDGRKAALDLRLVIPDAEPGSVTKVQAAMQHIFRIWRESREERSTQTVFCDISTPTAERFNVYDEIRSCLIEAGVPEREIAYIHDADTDIKKKALFQAMNVGQVRILFGSTEKMGAGTNVQKKLKVLHHLDAPWRPRDIEQREGRILRQGNENAQVGIYRYVTEGSFDAYMWQTLETKARFIQQVMSGKTSVREVEDLETGALSYAEIKAIASGNPAVLEKVRIDTEVRKLDMLHAAHQNQQYEIAKQIRDLTAQIKSSKECQAGMRADSAAYRAHEAEAFTMTVDGRAFSGKHAREEAGTAIIQIITAALWEKKGELRHIGDFRDFAILSSFSGREGEMPKIYLRGKLTYEAYLNPENPLGTIASIEYALRNIDRLANEEQSACERKEKALADYREQMHRPFEQEEHLRELLVRQQEMNKQLDLDKGESQVIDEAKKEDEEIEQE